MKKSKANPAVIGAFVIGAVVLAISLTLVLSGGRLFQPARQFVVVFDSSLHGLSVGAPVAFRGVSIGQVTSINPVLEARNGRLEAVNMVVAIQISHGQFHAADGRLLGTDDFNDEELARVFDERGIRAHLALQSLLTGQLYVNLDFFPGSPATKVDLPTPYPQIATTETGIQRLGRTIDTLPLEEIIAKVTTALDGIAGLATAEEIPSILAAAERTAAAAEQIAVRLDAQIDPLLDSLREAAQATAGAMEQARVTLDLEQGPAGDLVARLTRAAETADKTLEQARGGVAQLEHLLGDRSPERQRLQQALAETSAAARSLRLLADYLERHPEALLHGKRR